MFYAIAAIAGAALGAFVTYLFREKFFKSIYLKARSDAKRIIDEAQKEASRMRKEAQLEARERFLKLKAELDREMRARRERLDHDEKRLLRKEESLKRLEAVLREKENVIRRERREVESARRALESERENLEKERQKLRERESEIIKRLEQVAEMTREEAKQELLRMVESELKHEKAMLIKKYETELQETKKALAKEVIARAIQSIAAETVVETSVTVVDLPSDDMKGRIIGREGRNIRALEMATGVDFIVDDTPEAIILSSYDPLKREIAKIALQQLIADGRIHPARIEEVVERVKQEMEEKIREIGHEAVVELGLQDIHPELEYYLGKLKFRTSFGQNVLQHSKEVARLAAFMAREIGANVNVALRAGLLHDIGKAIDREYNQSHVELSVMLARKYGESEEVIQAIAAHHQDVDFPSVEAVLVQAADTLSAARPGARRELLENYVKRIETLERIATEFEGVTKAFALQAGREIRVIVNSEQLSDDDAFILSREIARKIEKELSYPGQIKVTVIREVRAIEYSR